MVSAQQAKNNRKACYPCVCGCLAIGCLLTLILVPLSFSKIEYYEAGLLAQKSTGNIDKETIYSAGNYFIGPDFEFKTYPVYLQIFNQQVSVWSKSGGTDAGATLKLDISFQYRIRVNDIGRLYNKVAQSYKSLVVTYALDAIKNTAPLFGVDEYLTKRPVIEAALKANVTKALQHDIYVDVEDLQLRRIKMSADYEQTKLNAAIQKEATERENYVQSREKVEVETSALVLKIDNEAHRVANAAVANANLIKETATYEAKKLIETKRSEGLKLMLQETGLVTDEHKASLDYITTLINNKAKVTPYVNMAQSGLLQKPVS